jgi:hypothetical protein
MGILVTIHFKNCSSLSAFDTYRTVILPFGFMGVKHGPYFEGRSLIVFEYIT